MSWAHVFGCETIKTSTKWGSNLKDCKTENVLCIVDCESGYNPSLRNMANIPELYPLYVCFWVCGAMVGVRRTT